MEKMDVPILHDWENHSPDWWMGSNTQPISKETLMQFIVGNPDLYRDRQCRWMLDCKSSEGNWTTVGAVDLYEFEPRQQRAGVAVHIDKGHRRQGHATAGLQLLTAFVRQHLGLRQTFAEVPSNHGASIRLFQKAGYRETGRREQWLRTPDGTWLDVITLQHFHEQTATLP